MKIIEIANNFRKLTDEQTIWYIKGYIAVLKDNQKLLQKLLDENKKNEQKVEIIKKVLEHNMKIENHLNEILNNM